MQYLRGDRKVGSVPQPFIEGLDEETNGHDIILSEVNYRTTRYRSDALQIGDHASCNSHNVSRRSTEVVVPGSRSRPHFVVLQQIRIDEHTQLLRVTKRRHATGGFGNSHLMVFR